MNTILKFLKGIGSVLVSPAFVSFYHRTIIMALVALIAFIINNISKFGLSVQVTSVIGLALGEVEQYLQNKEPAAQ